MSYSLTHAHEYLLICYLYFQGDIKNIGLESSTITKSKEEDLNEIYFDDINNYTKLKEINMVQSVSLKIIIF